MKMLKKKNAFGIRFHQKNDINEHDVRILKHPIRGLLDYQMKSGLFQVDMYYSTLDEIPLTTYLQKPMDFQTFKGFLQKVLDVFIEVEKHHLTIEQLLLDFDYIYVNEYSLDIEFAYIPYRHFDLKKKEDEFFLELIQYCHFLTGDSYQMVQDYIAFIQSKVGFHYVHLLEWLHSDLHMMDTTPLEEATVPLLLTPPPYFLLSNGDKIELTHFPFKIGSSQLCDYCIANPSVSRQHLLIEKMNEQYYITDLNSTNHTYIQNQMIESKQKVLLEEGMVHLANEQLEFHIV